MRQFMSELMKENLKVVEIGVEIEKCRFCDINNVGGVCFIFFMFVMRSNGFFFNIVYMR